MLPYSYLDGLCAPKYIVQITAYRVYTNALNIHVNMGKSSYVTYLPEYRKAILTVLKSSHCQDLKRMVRLTYLFFANDMIALSCVIIVRF